LNPSGYTLPGWYFGRAEEIQAAQTELEAALAARDKAQTDLDTLLTSPANVEFLAAETRLVNARAAFLVAQDVLTRANLATDNSDLKTAAQAGYDAAKTELQDAQSAFDGVANADAGKSIRTARGTLAAARERYDTAQDRLLALQTGIFSPRVAAAEAAVNQATQAVTQAGTNLALIDAQISKLTVSAPVDGIILSRSIQPGEVVSPGANAMTLGRLDNLTITVYVPDDRYGILFLGQSASVAVDSFPGESFTASIIFISDQAEFTPRNVQTVEGRSSTVFAIKLRVNDPNGNLKPGMPADVVFSNQ
jgi:HlyD family secretion protein